MTSHKKTQQEQEIVKMETETDSNGVQSEMKEHGSLVENGVSQAQDVNDPTFPAYCLEALLGVVEYLEGMRSRLITAQLHNEVCVCSTCLLGVCM